MASVFINFVRVAENIAFLKHFLSKHGFCKLTTDACYQKYWAYACHGYMYARTKYGTRLVYIVHVREIIENLVVDISRLVAYVHARDSIWCITENYKAVFLV